MAYSWWSMTQRGRRLNKDSTLVFLWIQVLFFVTSGGVSAETDIPHYTLYTEVGNITRINPSVLCEPPAVGPIDLVTCGIGKSPTEPSVFITRKNNSHGVIRNDNEHFDMDEQFHLVIQKTLSNDSGDYWCQVKPVTSLTCRCSVTLKLLNVTPNVANDPSGVTYRQIKTTPRASRAGLTTLQESPTSEAAPMFTSSTFTMALCLVSGILKIWRGFLPVRLTT